MSPEDETAPGGLCPNSVQPVPPECDTCPHCAAVLPASAEQASTHDETAHTGSQSAPAAAEDEWLDRILEDYD